MDRSSVCVRALVLGVYVTIMILLVYFAPAISPQLVPVVICAGAFGFVAWMIVYSGETPVLARATYWTFGGWTAVMVVLWGVAEIGFPLKYLSALFLSASIILFIQVVFVDWLNNEWYTDSTRIRFVERLPFNMIVIFGYWGLAHVIENPIVLKGMLIGAIMAFIADVIWSAFYHENSNMFVNVPISYLSARLLSVFGTGSLAPMNNWLEVRYGESEGLLYIALAVVGIVMSLFGLGCRVDQTEKLS